MAAFVARFARLAVFGALAACSGAGSSNGGAAGSSGNTAGTVNGKPAADFYGQFAYETTKGDLSGEGAMPSQPNGDDAFIVDLFLKKDGSFTLFYVEAQGSVGRSSSLEFDAKKGRKLAGTWTLDGEMLVAGPLRCGGFSYNGEDALSCAVTEKVVSAEAVGHASLLRQESPRSPDEASFADYK